MRMKVRGPKVRLAVPAGCLAGAVLLPIGAAGQAPQLDWGPHDVGFRVIEALDSTRAFRPLRDHRGTLAGETARPVQVSLWYPARVDAGAARMTGGDFRILRETELEFGRTVNAAERERIRTEFIRTAIGVGADSAAAARVWDAATPVVRDASPVTGPHATLLYATSAGTSNSMLPAYLASHGFAVASFPSNGRMTGGSLEFTPNALTLDTDIDDAGFAHALLRRLPLVDPRRLAVVSFSGGSLAALLWQMRDMQAHAIVALEGWERYRRGADIIAESVHYEPRRVRVPFLMIERAADEGSPLYAKVPDVVESLPYASITRIAFRDAAHGDFLSDALIGRSPTHDRVFAASARMIRLFLEAHLEGDDAAARTFAGIAPPVSDPFFTVSRDPAIGPVPTEEELYRLAETDPGEALATYRAATRIVPGDRLFREAVLTRAAIFAFDPSDRATIMELVTDAYPASVQAHFGLGEALAAAGRTSSAVAAFEAALSLVGSLPGNERATWRDRIGAALIEVRR
jgi:hypothetical protein